MSHEKRYYVYILSSKGRVLYVGVTGFLMHRVSVAIQWNFNFNICNLLRMN